MRTASSAATSAAISSPLIQPNALRPRRPTIHAVNSVPTAPMGYAHSLAHSSMASQPEAEIMAPPVTASIMAAHRRAPMRTHGGMPSYRSHQRSVPRRRATSIHRAHSSANVMADSGISHRACTP